jgi:hypothetical protein
MTYQDYGYRYPGPAEPHGGEVRGIHGARDCRQP